MAEDVEMQRERERNVKRNCDAIKSKSITNSNGIRMIDIERKKMEEQMRIPVKTKKEPVTVPIDSSLVDRLVKNIKKRCDVASSQQRPPTINDLLSINDSTPHALSPRGVTDRDATERDLLHKGQRPPFGPSLFVPSS